MEGSRTGTDSQGGLQPGVRVGRIGAPLEEGVLPRILKRQIDAGRGLKLRVKCSWNLQYGKKIEGNRNRS